MAELGHEVVGVDIDPGKVAKLAAGDVPFYEPGLRKMLSDNIAAGRLRFTTDYDLAAEFADVHFLGVGTPQKRGEYGADLSHVHAVIDMLVPRLTRPAVIVGKSTVPVGTAAELVQRARAAARPGVDVEVSGCTTPCSPIALCLASRMVPRVPRPRSVSCTHRCWTPVFPSW
jgi:UDPglucose 6-dehydrogenase